MMISVITIVKRGEYRLLLVLLILLEHRVAL